MCARRGGEDVPPFDGSGGAAYRAVDDETPTNVSLAATSPPVHLFQGEGRGGTVPPARDAAGGTIPADIGKSLRAAP